MLVKEVYPALVDSFCNGFSDLMRTPPVNHIQSSPSILGLGSGGSAHEEGVSQLALEVILLDVVG